MTSKTKWTCLIYLAGDNNLSPAADVDLREMRTVGSGPDVNIIAQVDQAGGKGTTRYCIQCDGKNEKSEALGEKDSGDPQTVIDFVKWAAKNYPAERYALILWNHGGGWEPSEMDRIARDVGTKSYTPREATERSATPLRRTFFRTSLQKIFSLSSPAERAICSDDGSGHSLDTVELGNVLDQAVKTLGQKIDLLGMDACLMSNLEVAYQVQPYANFMVASEESEPNNGWPYDTIMRGLAANADQETSKLAINVVHSYIKSYEDVGYSGAVTQAACDLSKLGELTGPLDVLAEALIGHMPEAADEVWKSQKNSARFWHNTLWDIAHWCEELTKVSSDKKVRDATLNVCDATKQGAGKFIIAESHRGNSVSRCGGSSIYLLPPLMDISRYYDELEFAKKHKWLSFLKAYHAV